jgi:hypothetical protein
MWKEAVTTHTIPAFALRGKEVLDMTRIYGLVRRGIT